MECQRAAAPFVADPASDADVEVEREALAERVRRVGEAVHDGGGELWRYEVDRKQQQKLWVRFGAHEVDATIHAVVP